MIELFEVPKYFLEEPSELGPLDHDAFISARDREFELVVLQYVREKLGPPPEGYRYEMLAARHGGFAGIYRRPYRDLFALEYIGDVFMEDGKVFLTKASVEIQPDYMGTEVYINNGFLVSEHGEFPGVSLTGEAENMLINALELDFTVMDSYVFPLTRKLKALLEEVTGWKVREVEE